MIGTALVALIAAVSAMPTVAQSTTLELFRSLDLAQYGPDEKPPPFVASTVNGQRLSLTSLRGHVVILTFWATWCQPCRDEMNAFERLHRDFSRDGLAIVGINTREEAGPIIEYARTLDLTFSLVVDSPGKVQKVYGVVGLPTTFLIARDGRAVARAIGSRDWSGDAARTVIRMLLGEAARRR